MSKLPSEGGKTVNQCPKCKRDSLERDLSTLRVWCLYAADCGYSTSVKDERESNIAASSSRSVRATLPKHKTVQRRAAAS